MMDCSGKINPQPGLIQFEFWIPQKLSVKLIGCSSRQLVYGRILFVLWLATTWLASIQTTPPQYNLTKCIDSLQQLLGMKSGLVVRYKCFHASYCDIKCKWRLLQQCNVMCIKFQFCFPSYLQDYCLITLDMQSLHCTRGLQVFRGLCICICTPGESPAGKLFPYQACLNYIRLTLFRQS